MPGVRRESSSASGGGYRMLNDIGGSCGDGASVEIVQLFLGGAETYAGCLAELDGVGAL